MSRRKKIVLWTLGALLLITLLRETGTVNLNWYNSNIEGETTTTWSDQHHTTEIPRRLLYDSLITGPCNYSNIASVPTYVWIDDYLVGDTVDCPQLGTHFRDVHYGFLYSPLYKAADFNASVPVNGGVILYVPHDTMVTVHNFSISGFVNVRGNIAASGLLSARTAREIIRRYVAEEVYAQVKAHLDMVK